MTTKAKTQPIEFALVVYPGLEEHKIREAEKCFQRGEGKSLEEVTAGDWMRNEQTSV